MVLPSSLVAPFIRGDSAAALLRVGPLGDSYCGRRTSTASSCAFREQGNLPTVLHLHSLFRQLDRPCPLPFRQLHFLIPAIRPLKLPHLIHLHDEGIGFVRLAAEPVPPSFGRLVLRPLIGRHSSFCRVLSPPYNRDFLYALRFLMYS